MDAIGCVAHEVDIARAASRCSVTSTTLCHGDPVYDVTFENVQAGERTSHYSGLPTSIKLWCWNQLISVTCAWCAPRVGDHMSHYSVNASVPKTFIQFLIRWVGDTNQLANKPAGSYFPSRNEFSPELIPSDPNGAPAQRTEDVIGPMSCKTSISIIRHASATYPQRLPSSPIAPGGIGH